VRSVERGFRTTRAAALGDRELAREAEVAAGDENLVAIRYSVQYQVSDPFAFHFRIAAPDTLIGAACEFALRQVMSGIETDSILVDHRPELETRVAQRLRAELDAIGAGISVLRVDFIDVHAPTEVHFSFRDVASAMEDRLSSVHQAESYRGDLLAGARGRAYSTVARARADSAATIASAAGRGRGFAALERATRSSRDLTRLRLYLDAAGRLLRAARVILPLVDLPVDLWIDRTAAARGWPAPIAPNTTGFPGGPGEIGGPRPREAGANPGEPAPENEGWRDKLQRLQESQR
jgi:membrane protease subunit HflK